MNAIQKTRKLLILIDGNAVLHRAWHALPPLSTKDGRVVSGAYGFMMTLLSAIRKFQPSHLIVTFDLAKPTFRHEQYEEYKAGRTKQPDELYAQIPILHEILGLMNIPILTAEGFEADDVIGTVARRTSLDDPDIRTYIVTGDLDTLQLVTDRVNVFTMRRGITDTVIYDPAQVTERYGLRPSQMIDYKALRGDTSDNIPGVKGIGEKTAGELIARFGSVAALYESLEGNDEKAASIKPGVREKLTSGKADALQARDLVTIRTDVPIDFDLTAAEFRPVAKAKLEPLFEELQFNRLLEQWPASPPAPLPRTEADHPVGHPSAAQPNLPALSPQGQTDVPNRQSSDLRGQSVSEANSLSPLAGRPVILAAAQLPSAIAEISTAKKIAVRTLLADEHPAFPTVLGLGIFDGKTTYFFNTNLIEKHAPEIRAVLESPKTVRYCHDRKREITALAQFDLTLGEPTEDLMLASYLMLAGDRKSELASLLHYYRQTEPAEKNPTAEEAIRRLAAELPHLISLTDEFLGKIGPLRMTDLYRNVELPLTGVLSRMERHGVLIDQKYFERLSADLGKELDRLTAEIHRLAGEGFNINSPKQLQEILFRKLGLETKGMKKTAKGGTLSTAAAELEKLAGLHPIIEPIMAYREAAKIKSTYADALPALAHPMSHRLHARFNQAITATGRLSSSDPNLQNIPTGDSRWSERVRRGFVAPKDTVLLAADYSQIELRIAAHLSQEETMLEAFRRHEDIHWRTAVTMFGEEEAVAKRRVAKAINFGILFGMGANQLAINTNLSRTEAQEYIDQYFALHPKLAAYLTDLKAKVARDGFVETIFGRRRFFPNFRLMNKREQAEAERQAVNTPIQGSEADIIKLAMIRLDGQLREEFGDRVRMVMQVHDELIFEVQSGLEGTAAALIRPAMAGVAELSVPIEVNIETGPNWGRLEALTVPEDSKR